MHPILEGIEVPGPMLSEWTEVDLVPSTDHIP